MLNQTKLRPPSSERRLCKRPRLVNRLREMVESAGVTLVTAQAGAGKTTLLAQYCEYDELGARVGWLSLDQRDNEPRRFWAHVVEELQVMGIRLSPAIDGLRRLGSSSQRVTELVPRLIGELEGSGPIILILDDFHLISSGQVLAEVEAVLDHPLSDLRLVIAGRADPPFSLAKYRASGSLKQLPASDLSFTFSEIESLANDIYGARLSVNDLQVLADRTEGWATGVQLALLNLAESDRPGELTEMFDEHESSFEYLWEEVVNRQPEEIQRFLVQTSILERLSPDLCDHVTLSNHSGAILEKLQDRNLFLVALDSQHRWYRYHHLFADALKTRLQLLGRDDIDELHRRAGQWHANHGDHSEAIRHVIAAGDNVLLLRLLNTHPDRHAFFNGRLSSASQLPVVSEWMRGLHPDHAPSDPRLCLLAAWVSISLGDTRQARAWLTVAADVVKNTTSSNGFTGRAEILLAWLVYYGYVGDLTSARVAGEHALEVAPRHSAVAAMVQVGLAMIHHWSGDLPAASHLLENATGHLNPDTDAIPLVLALGHLAELNRRAKRDSIAEQLATRAIGIADRNQLGYHYCTAMAHATVAAVFVDRGEFDEAEIPFARALAAARQCAEPTTVSHVLIHLSRLRHLQGREKESLGFLHDARIEAFRCMDEHTRDTILDWVDKELSDLRQRPLPEALIAPGSLTPRERAVLRLLSGCLTQPDIARELSVSLNTVKTHVKSIYAKLMVSSRDQAVARGKELGYLPT